MKNSKQDPQLPRQGKATCIMAEKNLSGVRKCGIKKKIYKTKKYSKRLWK